MTLKQLQAQARKLNIAGRSKMNKAQLEVAINGAELASLNKPKLMDVETFGRYLGTLTKGQARKARKEQRAAGRNDLAGAPRIVATELRKAA